MVRVSIVGELYMHLHFKVAVRNFNAVNASR